MGDINDGDYSRPNIDGYICYECGRKVISSPESFWDEFGYTEVVSKKQLRNGEFSIADFDLKKGINLVEEKK